MKKFKGWEETIDYLNQIKVDPKFWYAIRDNIYKWNIHPFTDDDVGVNMILKYLELGEDIEENPKDFFRNLLDEVILANLNENEKELVYEIGEKTFKDGLLTFNNEYLLKMVDEKDIQKFVSENILIFEDEKYKFQNILMQTYLAASKIIQKDEKINNDLFLPWLEEAECEYLNNESKILYIFSMLNIEKFNTEYLKENLKEFLSKIDTHDKFSIAQSMINSYGIIEEFKEDCNFLKEQSDYDMFLNFLDIQIVYDVTDTDFGDYESMLKLKFLNDNENIEIEYGKMKDDKILAKMLDECGVVDTLVNDFKTLKKIYADVLKNPKKDFCRNWEIRGVNL